MENYRLAPEATADLQRVWFYGLEHWGLEAAVTYYATLFDHFKQLAEQPLLYSAVDIRDGYRRSVCGSDCVYYRIDGGSFDFKLLSVVASVPPTISFILLGCVGLVGRRYYLGTHS